MEVGGGEEGPTDLGSYFFDAGEDLSYAARPSSCPFFFF